MTATTHAALERRLNLAVDMTDLEGSRRQLIDLAKSELSAAIARGAPSLYDRAVNFEKDRTEESVRLPGPIAYAFDWVPEAARFALFWLQARSPVKTGFYRRNHRVVVRGQMAGSPTAIPKFVEDGGVVVSNFVDYARKVHFGQKRAAGALMVAMRGLYDDAASAVNRTFRGVVRARVKFIDAPGGGGSTYRIRYQRSFAVGADGSTSPVTRRVRDGRRRMTYPALVFERID